MENITAAAIEEFIKKELAKLLSISTDSIDIETPFDKFGLESAKSILMVGKLEDYLDVDLPSRLLWDYNNIKSLSVYLQELFENQ
jgi:acyl carrier protein